MKRETVFMGAFMVLMLLTVSWSAMNIAQSAVNRDSGLGVHEPEKESFGVSREHPSAMPSFTELATGDSTNKYSTVWMADVDGVDGYAEILSGAGKYGSASVPGLYYWQYDGTKYNKKTITSDGYYGQVILSDVNGDSIPDAVAAGESRWSGGAVEGLVLYKGAHTGSSITFTAMTSPYKTVSADSVAVGDINNDGHNDIVLGTYGDGVKVFINDGAATPTWTMITLYTGSNEITGVAVGKLNGDDYLDVVATNYNGGNTRVFLCTGVSPSVTFSIAYTTGLSTGTAFGIGIADFNSDGKNDLAIGTRSNGFKVYLGNGCSGDASTWWTAGSVSGSTTGDRMQVSVGDVNKDGKIDIAFASGEGIVVLENNGVGSFSKATVVGLPDSDEYYGCFLYDCDGDGDLDIAGCGWGRGVRYYRNDHLTVPDVSHAPVVLTLAGAFSISAVIIVNRRLHPSDSTHSNRRECDNLLWRPGRPYGRG